MIILDRLKTGGTGRIAIVALCVTICAIVYLRGLATPIGIRSFGRDFLYYVTYTDFGFVHRGLIGTLLSVFADGPAEDTFAMPFMVFPWFMAATLLAGTVFAYRLFRDAGGRNLYLAMLLLSPSFLIHYAYSNGDFNVLLALFLILSVLCARRGAAPFLLLVPAMLIHEIFFVAFAPAVCVALYVADERRLARAAAYAVFGLVLFALIVSFGRLEMPYEQYIEIMRMRSPNLYYHGYLEMAADLRSNIEYTTPLFSSAGKVVLIAPLLLYWAILAGLFFPADDTRFVQLIYVAACAAPLSLIPFGTDLFRWISLACVATLVLGGFLASRGAGSRFVTRPRHAGLMTLPWVVLGPFGATCDPTLGCLRVFPMFQFALERIG